MAALPFDVIFRDFDIEGEPASGEHHPRKDQIRDALNAIINGPFPDNRVIRLNNANSGSANNIIVTAAVSIPAAAYQVLYVLNVTKQNTGPVTVSGAINRTLVTNTSRPVPAGYLTPGMAVLCIDTGTTLRMLSYGDMEVLVRAAQVEVDKASLARAAAEAARDIAAGYASDAVSQGNVPIYGTIAGLSALEIPEGINVIRMNGYHAAGDGGEATLTDEDNGTALIAESGGGTARPWFLSTQVTRPEQFGAKPCPSPWRGSEVSNTPDCTAAFQAMIKYCEITGAVCAPTGRAYVLKDNSPGLEIGSGFRCKGAGTAWWQRGTIAGSGIDLSGATTLIFAGTGQKIRTAHGVTSCRTSGGEVVNPNGGATISLWSGYNDDADETTGEGATIKPFSAGIWVKPGSVDVDLDGITVLVSYNGLEGYNLVADGLADDWDFAVFWDNARESHINLTTVGYWRQGGVLFRGNLYPNEIDPTRYGGLERVVGNLKAQGNTSVLMRGADHFRITDVTSTYVEVPWASNHPFSATRQEMKMFGVGQVTVSSAFTITAIAKVGDKLRLTTNVNPLEYGLSAGQFIQPAWFGAGCAGFNIELLAVGLFHQTGRRSETFGLSSGKGIEISGARISRPIFTGRVNNAETVHTHLHTVDRPLLAMEWEGKNPSGGVAGGLNIASPAPSSNTRVPNPGPGTNVAQYQATQVLNSDFMPYFGSATPATPNGGLFEPNAVSFDYFQFPPRARGTKPITAGNGEDVILEPGNGARKFSFSTAGRIASDGELIFRTSVNHRFEFGSTENMRIFGASGNVQFNGTQILSSSNNRLTLGSASVAIKDVFSVNAVTVTSDERSKNVRGDLLEAEKRAARKIMGNVKIYQLKAAVAEKGDEARLHVGFIAQTVRDVLVSEGLNPFKYGFLCEDEILEKVSRKAQRLVQKTVQREISHTHIVFEDGFAREVVSREIIDDPVFERVRLLDASGNPILNEDGSLKTVESPVMVTEYVDVEETFPSMEDDGNGNLVPKKRLSLRYEELFAFILGACDFPETESVGN